MRQPCAHTRPCPSFIVLHSEGPNAMWHALEFASLCLCLCYLAHLRSYEPVPMFMPIPMPMPGGTPHFVEPNARWRALRGHACMCACVCTYAPRLDFCLCLCRRRYIFFCNDWKGTCGCYFLAMLQHFHGSSLVIGGAAIIGKAWVKFPFLL